MLEIIYLFSFFLVLFVVKKYPTNVMYIFIVNFMHSFAPLVNSLIDANLYIFDTDLIISLLLIFNSSIAVFHILFLVMKRKEYYFIELKEYKYAKYILYFLGMAAIIVIYKNFNQASVALSSGYIEGYQNVVSESIKATTFFPFLLMFYFLIFSLYLRNDRTLFLFIMLVIVISYFAYGSRSFVFYSSISIVVFLVKIKKFTYTKILIIATVLLPILLIVGSMREGTIDFAILYRLSLELSNIPMIISNIDILNDLNQSVFNVIVSMLPHSIILPLGIEPVNSLSTEFVKLYDPGWAESGGGFGFTIIGEIYYRFGYLGLILLPYLLMLFLRFLEKKYVLGDEFDKALMLSFYYALLMWIRGDFIEISRLLMIIFVFYLIKRLKYNVVR